MNKTPKSPEELNDTGHYYWNIYCEALIKRDSLTQEISSSVEQLCYLEQCRKDVEQEINHSNGFINRFTTKTGDDIIQSSGADKIYLKIASQIQTLKKELHLLPEKPKKADKTEESKSAKQKLLNRTKNF